MKNLIKRTYRKMTKKSKKNKRPLGFLSTVFAIAAGIFLAKTLSFSAIIGYYLIVKGFLFLLLMLSIYLKDLSKKIEAEEAKNSNE